MWFAPLHTMYVGLVVGVDADKYFCRQVKFVGRIKLDFAPVKNGNVKKAAQGSRFDCVA